MDRSKSVKTLTFLSLEISHYMIMLSFKYCKLTTNFNISHAINISKPGAPGFLKLFLRGRLYAVAIDNYGDRVTMV